MDETCERRKLLHGDLLARESFWCLVRSTSTWSRILKWTVNIYSGLTMQNDDNDNDEDDDSNDDNDIY